MRLIELYLGSSKGMQNASKALSPDEHLRKLNSSKVSKEKSKMLEAQGIDSQSSLSGSVRRSELSVKTRDVTQKEDSYKTPRMRTNPRSKGIALLNDYESEVGLLPSSRKHWNHN